MKKSFLKKVLTAAMAVLMISSCVPLAAVAADEEVNYSSAIAAYKQKMSEAAASKTVYKNMAESYTYYMAAVKYNDGYDTSDANKALADKLAAATETTFAESNKYTGPDKVNELYTKGNSGNLIDSQYYSNLLSRPDISQTDSHQSDDIYFGVSVNGYSFVWLYDGSEMKAPINGYCRVTSGKVDLLDIFRTDGDFEIVNEYWNFQNSSSSDNFYTTNDGTCYTTQVDSGSKGFWPGSQKQTHLVQLSSDIKNKAVVTFSPTILIILQQVLFFRERKTIKTGLENGKRVQLVHLLLDRLILSTIRKFPMQFKMQQALTLPI